MNKEEIQNNYIEMLIQDLEAHSFDYWESTQNEMVEALRNLQQKVNQLETNRDEAIDYIKIHRQTYDIDGSIEPKLDDFNILASPKKLISILERGKE